MEIEAFAFLIIGAEEGAEQESTANHGAFIVAKVLSSLLQGSEIEGDILPLLGVVWEAEGPGKSRWCKLFSSFAFRYRDARDKGEGFGIAV